LGPGRLSTAISYSNFTCVHLLMAVRVKQNPVARAVG